jgi:hypothetical protein
VIERKTDKNVEITLQHLVAAHEPADLTFAVLYQSSHLGRRGRSGAEDNHAKVQLRPLRFLRVSGRNRPLSYRTSNTTNTSLNSKGFSQDADGQGIISQMTEWIFFHNLTEEKGKKELVHVCD